MRRCIADQLVIYDRNHFGKANAEQLNLNYTNLTKEAEKIDPFANKEDDEKGSIDVSKIVFTDKDGNEISLNTEYGENNVLRVFLRDIKTDGTVYVTYSGTAIQHISFWLNVCAVILLAGWILYSRVIKDRKRYQENSLVQVTEELSEQQPAE